MLDVGRKVIPPKDRALKRDHEDDQVRVQPLPPYTPITLAPTLPKPKPNLTTTHLE